MKYDLEIVTHCFARNQVFYRAQLQFQVASLFYFCPPDIKVCLSVCTTQSDHETRDFCRLANVQLPDYITLNVVQLQPGFLYRRAIGRNIRALIGEARVYWFCDVDYFFGKKCLRTLLNQVNEKSGLVFPNAININTDHATGDAMTAGLTPEEKLFPPFDESLFTKRRQKTCIGGIHIIGHDRLHAINPATGRSYGYINGHKMCRPVDAAEGFRQCRCDVPFKAAHKPATPIEVQNVFRIRHSDAGRCFDADGNRIKERPEGKTHD